MTMRNLDVIVQDIQTEMEELEEKRELAVMSSRQIVRKTKKVIHSLHQGSGHEDAMREALGCMQELTMQLEPHPQILHSGVVADAMMELSEAAILASVAGNDDLPTPESLTVTPAAWVMGMADAIGEMRRMTLDMLREGRCDDAEGMLDSMDLLYTALSGFDSPDAILPVRRKQDVARSLVEKTRADVTSGVSLRRLR